jgi:hypothetical protein
MTIRHRLWGLLACGWSGSYLILAIGWKLGAPNYPYGRGWDPSPYPVSLLDGVSRSTGTTIMIIAATCAVLGSAALMVSRSPGRLPRTGTALIIGICLGLVLVGDYRPLMAIARTPVFVITRIGWGVGEGQSSIWQFVRAMYSVPALHGFWQLAGLLILLLAVRECWRRIHHGCSDCGRPEQLSWWSTRSGARSWGTIATMVAVICPLPYALTRYLLLAGIPTDGFNAEQIQQLNREAPGIWIFGAGLATFGVLGAILTLGLVQRWGERWPFWVPGLRGRPINPWVAIVPAGLVSLLWPSAALMFLRINIHRYLDGGQSLLHLLLSPMNLWLFWGFALAGATLAYWLRRRPDCPTCGRGIEPMRGVWVPKGQQPTGVSSLRTTSASSLG